VGIFVERRASETAVIVDVIPFRFRKFSIDRLQNVPIRLANRAWFGLLFFDGHRNG
jgi:hypothetical protein